MFSQDNFPHNRGRPFFLFSGMPGDLWLLLLFLLGAFS